MLALEDEFGVEFPDETLKKSTFASIDSIERVVSSLTD
jgi:acyl carrier protein